MTCPLRLFDSLWEEDLSLAKNNDDRKVNFLLVDYSLFQRQFLNERFPGPWFPRDRTIKCKWSSHRDKSAQVYSYIALYRFQSYLSLRVFQLIKDECLGGCICIRYYNTCEHYMWEWVYRYSLRQCFSWERFRLFIPATFLCIHKYSTMRID